MRRVAPLLALVSALVVLLGLGTWQLQRLAWKEGLLAAIARAETEPPAPLRDPAAPLSRVEARGRFDHAREALLGLEVRGATLGAHLITPLMRDGATPVLVDRGWVPLERGVAIARPEGDVVVIGWIRAPEPGGSMAAEDDLAGRRFYSLDPQKIGAALGLPAVAPYALTVLGVPERGVLPAPSPTMPRPTNSHLGYAITWFGLAGALLGVFAAWAWPRSRKTP